MADHYRVEIGFSGGGSTSVAAEKDEWESLQKALSGGGGGWVTIGEPDDTTFLIDTSKVVYVRTTAPTRAIGFGTA